ncbi:MAG: leucine--tRNA ligase [Chloroflexota bacterium]|nr:leucine--tRNA ligase [Chloroflexota bacterium]
MTMQEPPDRYTPAAIEPRWQAEWAATDLYHVQMQDTTRPPYYFLTMLPYPSGDLHIGHWFTMAPSDTRARYLRMQGYNVFFPIGFDAFGLPAENAAIKRNIHPKIWTYANMDKMRGQFKSMGAIFPWDHEVITCDPEYYRWNQWFFVQFFKRGLAYRKFAPVDWCPSCNTTLAREQVVGEDRHCERCDTPVIKRDLHQWLFKITAYAEELLDFSKMQWPERVETLQRNWIGRSAGAEVVFAAQPPAGGDPAPITVFTTRPDTLWGATFLVLAPEHPLVAQLTAPVQQATVADYITQAGRQTEIDRLAEDKEKTGVPLGAYAINPVNGARIPIWIADYVLVSYGTGAIMAVPAHDQRDFEFARKYDLPIVPVITPAGGELPDPAAMTAAYKGGDGGVLANSGPLDGTPAGTRDGESVQAAIAYLTTHNQGQAAITYRLRDWLVSRQRYWGTPIPILYCPTCGEVPVPEDQLPVLLPDDVDFRPTGESPLKLHPTWRFTTCPQCGGPAERDTDTMDTFVDSSWYHYRYLSPHYAAGPFDPALAGWLPVAQYTGGIEHAVMHLLYTRFWTKAMRDLGLVTFDEPMTRLFNQGIILGPDGARMSKSRGNVIDPDDLVRQYGADAVRCFLMFIGPWDQGGPWNPRGMEGIIRWLNRVWTLATDSVRTEPESDQQAAPVPNSTLNTQHSTLTVTRRLHQTIRDVGDDTDAFRFNTAISAMMELTNALMKARADLAGSPAWDEAIRTLLLILAPYTPHLAEELWARRGGPYSIHNQPWPTWNPALAAEDTVEIPVQINGKVRDKLQVPADADPAALESAARASPRIAEWLAGKPIRRVIVVPGKLVNILA